MRNRFLAILPLAALVGGCVSSDFMRVGNQSFPPRPDNYVIDVFVPLEAPVNVQKAVSNAKSTKEIPANAVVIGRIDTHGAPDAGWSAMFKDAKHKARELGGDGIVIGNWGNSLNGVDGYGRSYYGKDVSLTVIRFRP